MPGGSGRGLQKDLMTFLPCEHGNGLNTVNVCKEARKKRKFRYTAALLHDTVEDFPEIRKHICEPRRTPA